MTPQPSNPFHSHPWPGMSEGRIPFSYPAISDIDLFWSINAIINETEPSKIGTYSLVREFENKFSKYIGCKYAIAVSSATTGLEACYLAVNDRADCSVITTPFTFHSTVSSAVRAGMNVTLVDVVKDGFHIDDEMVMEAIEEVSEFGDYPRAICVVHIYGVPCNMYRYDFLDKEKVTVIEDAAHAMGASYESGKYAGRKVGSIEDNLCVFSFNQQKILSAFGGGMITTGNKELAEKIRCIVHQGMIRNGAHRNQVMPGIKGGMEEFNAAMGIRQLEAVDDIISKRKNIASIYHSQLSGINGIDTPVWIEPINGAVWSHYTICALRQSYLAEKLLENKVETQVAYRAIHRHPYWESHESIRRFGRLSQSEVASSYVLSLPIFPSMNLEHILKVSSLVKKYGEVKQCQ